MVDVGVALSPVALEGASLLPIVGVVFALAYFGVASAFADLTGKVQWLESIFPDRDVERNMQVMDCYGVVVMRWKQMGRYARGRTGALLITEMEGGTERE